VWERLSVERWIFTAAHELGHLLLHLDAYDVSKTDDLRAKACGGARAATRAPGVQAEALVRRELEGRSRRPTRWRPPTSSGSIRLRRSRGSRIDWWPSGAAGRCFVPAFYEVPTRARTLTRTGPQMDDANVRLVVSLDDLRMDVLVSEQRKLKRAASHPAPHTLSTNTRRRTACSSRLPRPRVSRQRSLIQF